LLAAARPRLVAFVIDLVKTISSPSANSSPGCAKLSGNVHDYRGVPRREVAEHVRAQWARASGA
jgi:hypothetical protein